MGIRYRLITWSVEEAEERLNEMAADGWRPIESYPGNGTITFLLAQEGYQTKEVDYGTKGHATIRRPSRQ